jgi:hypothetical protein
MTFEEYLAAGVDQGVREFRLVPVVMGTEKRVTFYIHPLGKDGFTHDYLVKENLLVEVRSAFEGTIHPFEPPQTIVSDSDTAPTVEAEAA